MSMYVVFGVEQTSKLNDLSMALRESQIADDCLFGEVEIAALDILILGKVKPMIPKMERHCRKTVTPQAL